MKKLNLNNTVIEVLDVEHGQRVKEFFLKHCNEKQKDRILNSLYNCSRKNESKRRFYGYINKLFNNYSLPQVGYLYSKNKITIARLEDFEPKFPREMYVWDHKMHYAKKEIVYSFDFDNSLDFPIICSNERWKNAMEVDEWEDKCKIKYYTLKELEEKLGEKIKIVG